MLLVLFCVFCNVLSQQLSFNWDTVKIGGGGYTIGLTQSSDGTIYSRTDVGGVYRFNESNGYWQQLLDWIPVNEQNLFGTDAFAVSPTNPNTIYTVSGMYEWNQPFYVMISNDKGNSWKKILPINNFIAGGNEEDRWTGSRLTVYQNITTKQDILYLGTRTQSLLKSIDNGNTWNVVTTFPFKNTTNNGTVPVSHLGILWVNYNPFNSNIVIVMLNGYGIYQSVDNGIKWENIANNLTCYRSKFNHKINNNMVYMCCEEGVFAYNISTGSMLNISPEINNAFVGIDISNDGTKLFVSRRCNTNNKPWNYNPIYYTDLNDFKWSQVSYNNINVELPWLPNGWFAACVSDILCDNAYNDCRRILYSDFFLVWFNDNIYGNDTIHTNINMWYTKAEGHEEMFAFGLATPITNKSNNGQDAVLISGAADCGGFRHLSPMNYPETNYRMISESFMGIDFCESNPNIIVMVTGGEGLDINNTGYISYDNGKTFNNKFKSTPPSFNNTGYYGGRIYINPNNCDHFVWIPLSNYPFVSIDAGQTWIKSNNAPMNISGIIYGWQSNPEWVLGYNMHFMNDRINGSYLYIWDFRENKVYTSSDGGYNFSVTNDKLPGYKGNDTLYLKEGGYLSTDFAKKGHLCICLGLNGLWCSTDYAVTFNIIKGIYICRMVTFGRTQKSQSDSIMYFYGITNMDKQQKEGMYVVFNNNDNYQFVKMNNESYELGDNVRVAMGDRNVFGRVYVGSNGRGIYYSTLSN